MDVAPSWQWAARLTGGRFVRAVAVLLGGSALGQALVLVFSPVLTRLYAPAAFGELAVFTASLYVLTVISALRFEIAIPLPRDSEDATALLRLALTVVTLTTAAVTVLVLVAGKRVAGLLNTPELTPHLWLLPLTLLLAGWYASAASWAVREQRFPWIARAILAQNGVMVLVQVALGLAGSSAIGLLAGVTLGQAAATATLALLLLRSGEARRLLVMPAAAVRVVAGGYRRFPLLSFPAALTDSFSLSLPMLALAVLYDPHVVGLYVLAQRLLARPVELLAAAVCQVYNANIARAAVDAPERLMGLFQRVSWTMLALSVPYVAGLSVAAHWLVPVIFGDAWAEAATYMALLAVMYTGHALASPTAGTLDLLQRQDLNLMRELARLALLATAIGVASVLAVRPAVAVALLSAAAATAALFYVALAAYAIARRKDEG